MCSQLLCHGKGSASVRLSILLSQNIRAPAMEPILIFVRNGVGAPQDMLPCVREL